jgi:hypothetical protein
MKIDAKQKISLLGISPLTTKEFFKIPVSNIETKEYTKEYFDEEIIFIPKYIYVERNESVRYHKSTFSKKVISSLSPISCKMFLYLMSNIKRNADFVDIDIKHCMKWMQITSINTYKKALKEIISNIIIVPTKETNVYWINPDVFYNGNRIKHFPDNVDIIQDMSRG